MNMNPSPSKNFSRKFKILTGSERERAKVISFETLNRIIFL
jgi:hypothetical protein